MIRDLVAVFFRWNRDFVLVVVCIVMAAIAYAYMVQPVFESTASVLLVAGRDKKPFLPDQFTAQGSPYIPLVLEDVVNEVKIITCRPVLESAASRIAAEGKADTVGVERGFRPLNEIKTIWRNVKTAAGIATDTSRDQSIIEEIRAKLSVVPVPRTSVISIQYRDPSPARAKRAVNYIVDSYIAHHLKVFSNSGAASAIKILGDECDAKLRIMEDSLKAFKTMHDIIDADLEFADIQRKLTEARSKLLLLKRFDPMNITASDLANVSDDPTFAQLQTKLTDAELEYVELSSRYGKNEGKVIAAANAIREIKRFIGQRIYVSLETWNQLAKKYQSRFGELEQKRLAINHFEREIEALKQVRLLSSQKSNEVVINSALDHAAFTSVRVLEYGDEPKTPVFPNKKLIILLSFVFGPIFGITFVFMRNATSSFFFSVADVESLARKPVLASIPNYGHGGREDPHVAASRALGPAVSALDASAQPSVSLVVALSRGDGASFISTALGHILSQRPGNRVVRVDVVTEPSLPMRSEKKFEITSSLSHEAVAERIVRSYFGNTDYLNILASPSMVPEPKNIERFIGSLRQLGYTHIFIDISAHKADPHYLSFAPFASKIFAVVTYGRTKRFALLRMISLLERDGRELTGCIFNRRKNEIPEIIYQWM